MLLSDVCLSVAYIGPKSRTERPRKTKIGSSPRHTGLGHHFQGQKVKGQGHQDALPSAALTRKVAAVVSVGKYCYVASARRRARRLGGHGGGDGRGHIVSPRAQLFTGEMDFS